MSRPNLAIESRCGFRTLTDGGRSRLQLGKRSNVRWEKRAEGDVPCITGYASVFYDAAKPEESEYWLWDDMVERIMPGAFDAAIASEQNVRALFNHDPNWLLGSTRSKTCRLSTDSVGLRYEVDSDPTNPQWATIESNHRREDITGSSFAFRATKIVWVETPDYDIREIHEVELKDVGPVTYPAYEGSTAGLRSADQFRDAVPNYIVELRRERSRYLDDSPMLRSRLIELECDGFST